MVNWRLIMIDEWSQLKDVKGTSWVSWFLSRQKPCWDRGLDMTNWQPDPNVLVPKCFMFWAVSFSGDQHQWKVSWDHHGITMASPYMDHHGAGHLMVVAGRCRQLPRIAIRWAPRLQLWPQGYQAMVPAGSLHCSRMATFGGRGPQEGNRHEWSEGAMANHPFLGFPFRRSQRKQKSGKPTVLVSHFLKKDQLLQKFVHAGWFRNFGQRKAVPPHPRAIERNGLSMFRKSDSTTVSQCLWSHVA